LGKASKKLYLYSNQIGLNQEPNETRTNLIE